MTDREKAIRILEGNYKSFVLRHNGELLTVNELIALLKAQEPPKNASISSAIERLLHPQDADDSDMAKAIDTAVRVMRSLREQEPRVMTLDEVRAAEVVWFEQVGACVCAIKIQNFDSGTMSFAYAHNNYTSFVNIKPKYYGKISRCWTSRPTDAQREAIPWQ